VLGAIATEKNDCNFPQRRQLRRIRKSENHNRPGTAATSEPKNLAATLSATLTQKPKGKLIPLDRLFQERSHRHRRVGPFLKEPVKPRAVFIWIFA
jgi:hypothetical protein